MTWRTATRVVTLGVPVAVGLYDLVAFMAAGDSGTISRYCLTWCGPAALAVVFAWGVLAGHFWCPQHPDAARDKIPGRLQ